MRADIDRPTIEKAYARWAPVYDVLCGPVFLGARKAATASARRAGRDILEIGVGTGLSFGDYSAEDRVTGIDLSQRMIARARQRLTGGRFRHVVGLDVMDAHALRFDDASFDAVVAQFVVTLVASPERVLDEAARVLRPGGELILVNHFRSETPLAARLEERIAPHVRPLGLRPEFAFTRIEDWIASQPEMRLIERRRLAPFRAFTLVRIGKA